MEDKIRKLDYLIHAIFVKDRILNLDSSVRNLTKNELAAIVMIKNGIVVKELQMKLQLPKSTLSNIIRKLEDKKYVQREINPTDKRSYIVRLTDKGQSINRKHEKVEQKMYEEALNNLDNDYERDELLRLLEKILTNRRRNNG